jgi:hypothetical protein
MADDSGVARLVGGCVIHDGITPAEVGCCAALAC